MRAEIERIAGVLRVFDEDKEYGEPYEWAATVRWLSKDEIEIMGDVAPISCSIYRAIVDECVRLGIKRALRVTYKDGIRKEKWITNKGQ